MEKLVRQPWPEGGRKLGGRTAKSDALRILPTLIESARRGERGGRLELTYPVVCPSLGIVGIVVVRRTGETDADRVRWGVLSRDRPRDRSRMDLRGRKRGSKRVWAKRRCGWDGYMAARNDKPTQGRLSDHEKSLPSRIGDLAGKLFGGHAMAAGHVLGTFRCVPEKTRACRSGALQGHFGGLGRSARGERFLSGEWRSHLEVWQAGQLLWVDPQWLLGGSKMLQSAHGLSGCAVVGSFGFVGRDVSREFVAEVRSVLAAEGNATELPAAEIGATRLMNGFLCRYRGSSTAEAKQQFIKVWDLLRRHYLGRSSCLPRVWQR